MDVTHSYQMSMCHEPVVLQQMAKVLDRRSIRYPSVLKLSKLTRTRPLPLLLPASWTAAAECGSAVPLLRDTIGDPPSQASNPAELASVRDTWDGTAGSLNCSIVFKLWPTIELQHDIPDIVYTMNLVSVAVCVFYSWAIIETCLWERWAQTYSQGCEWRKSNTIYIDEL